MKILLVTQYFWPEEFIINDLVKTLVQQGHFVSILTGKPNYPQGVIYDGYVQQGCVEEEFIPGVNVFRVPLRPRGKGSAKSLFLNYCSFVINGAKYFPFAVKNKKFDVIFSVGFSPITSIIPAILLKWRLKIPLILWIQDLWPNSLKATGYVKNPFALWLVGLLVRVIYFFSDVLLIQSKSFNEQVKSFAKEDKIIYYANSYVDKSPMPDGENVISSKLLKLLEENFCVIFAGNLGSVQALDTLLSAAAGLKDIGKFKMIIVGTGSREIHLKNRIKNENIEQVVLTGRYSADVMPEIFKRSAALIVSLKNDELLSYTVPSKIQAYLASGRPIIAALNGEGAKIIEEARAGFACPAEDTEALMSCIRLLYHMSVDARDHMGRNGRQYFLENFEIEKQAIRLIDIFKQRIIPNEE